VKDYVNKREKQICYVTQQAPSRQSFVRKSDMLYSLNILTFDNIDNVTPITIWFRVSTQYPSLQCLTGYDFRLTYTLVVMSRVQHNPVINYYKI